MLLPISIPSRVLLAFVAVCACASYSPCGAAAPKQVSRWTMPVSDGEDVEAGLSRFFAMKELRLRPARPGEAAVISRLLNGPTLLALGVQLAPLPVSSGFKVSDVAATEYEGSIALTREEKWSLAGKVAGPVEPTSFAAWVAGYLRSGWFSIGALKQSLKVKEWRLKAGPSRLTAVIKVVSKVDDATAGGARISEGVVHFEVPRSGGEIRVYAWRSFYSIRSQ